MKKNTETKKDIRPKIFEAIKKELVKTDVLRNLRAEMRKSILDVVRGDECKEPMEEDTTLKPFSPTDLLNQLILDYFEWMNLKYSSDMLTVESGTKMKTSRKKLRRMFKNSDGFSKRMPVLLELMTTTMIPPKKM
jgi:hypothetical protein